MEFGVLHSEKQAGKGRYPKQETISKFLLERLHNEAVKLSAHLCGSICRDFFKTPNRDWRILSEFDRIQLNRNFAKDPLNSSESWDRVHENAMTAFRPNCTGKVILQLNPNNIGAICDLLTNPNNRITRHLNLLYDHSGGRGKVLDVGRNLKLGFDQTIANTYAAETIPGYAGGITVKNVKPMVTNLDMLYRFQKRNQFSIDMESGLRDDDDRFSVDLACQVVRTCADAMEELYKSPV